MPECKDIIYYIIYTVSAISTAIFSLLLFLVTRKSNEINANNLNLQEKILKYQRMVRNNENQILLSNLWINILFYRGELDAKYRGLEGIDKGQSEQYKIYANRCLEIIKTYGPNISTVIPEIRNVAEFIKIRKSILAHEMDIKTLITLDIMDRSEIERLTKGLIDVLAKFGELVANETNYISESVDKSS